MTGNPEDAEPCNITVLPRAKEAKLNVIVWDVGFVDPAEEDPVDAAAGVVEEVDPVPQPTNTKGSAQAKATTILLILFL
jgi:hypothetical protein